MQGPAYAFANVVAALIRWLIGHGQSGVVVGLPLT
jgi:hypothetical protein